MSCRRREIRMSEDYVVPPEANLSLERLYYVSGDEFFVSEDKGGILWLFPIVF